MNKLPWFTHDHDAHTDLFICEALRRFKHFGYTAYFITLELLHWHGVGDTLEIPIFIYRQKLRVERGPGNRTLARFLTFAIDSEKFEIEIQNSELSWVKLEINSSTTLSLLEDNLKLTTLKLRIKIKKFRERQAKLKSKIPSRLHQDSAKTPIYIEEEREGDNKQHIQRGKLAENGDKIDQKEEYTLKTPLDVIMAMYKRAKGVEWNDRSWDKANYKTWARSGNKLLQAFGGNYKAARDYLAERGEKLNEKNLEWNLATIAKNAWDSEEVGRHRNGSKDS